MLLSSCFLALKGLSCMCTTLMPQILLAPTGALFVTKIPSATFYISGTLQYTGLPVTWPTQHNLLMDEYMQF